MNTIAKNYSQSHTRNVGIDVGKDNLDVFIFDLDLHWQIANTVPEVRRLLITLNRYKLTRIVVEATGGYERLLVEACAEKEMPLVIAQPM